MKVLVFNPQQRRGPALFFPLGIGYIAAVLRDAGHNVRVLDAWSNEWDNTDVERTLKSELPKCDIFMSGALTPSFSYFEWLLKTVKKITPNVMTVIGNTVVDSPVGLLNSVAPVDYGIVGEGEATVVELVNTIENKKDPHDVAGLVFKDLNGKIVETKKREPIKDLDKIPLPAYDLFPTADYVRRPFFGSGRMPKANICSARGCTFNCFFCRDIFKSYSYRHRSAQNTVDEIEFLQKRYGVRFISFSDPLFTANKEHVISICDELERRRLKIKWAADSRANLADEELYKKMQEIGCSNLDHGFESGANKILAAMNKRATAEQAIESARICRKVGIIPSGTTMLGFPGENKDTATETLEFRKEIDVEFCPMFFCTAFPNTWLWDWCIKNGRIKDPLAYVRSLGEMLNKPYVNCTDFSDDELVALRDSIDSEVKREYVRKHPLWPAKRLFWRAYNYYKYYGAKGLIKKGLNTLKNK